MGVIIIAGSTIKQLYELTSCFVESEEEEKQQVMFCKQGFAAETANGTTKRTAQRSGEELKRDVATLFENRV